ncbi:3-hydroxyacyl-CoA dehydrogenase [Plasticicumulans acidivorans]|uniref:3-hydroxyacyl-CoA dehydrogenase n=1 Tax=Plasticicumulans acidivorans TaxID=886464 RepID=A0A317MMW6_9GAMM|nr:3-hydroxyacyl-CoA dehydrogenase [Plasticicumulans acidivorans]PWV57769.1 3-hydroxyacyl-CoA dehydrogenase [Plasticicumulans acidivorans]
MTTFTLDIQAPGLRLGIVGAGVMGRGIAQIAAQAGIRTQLYDARPQAAAEARSAVGSQLERLEAKGKLAAGASAAALARIEAAPSLAALADCDIVIEAIVENLDAKRALIAELEAVLAPQALIASNTSSLSVTAIAARAQHPERIAGMHFFNPVPLMKIVEVIDGLLTAPGFADALLGLGERMGHVAVRAKDTPGFIVNHGGRGYGTEAMRILGESITDVVSLDRILRDCAGFRMGPCELLDLTGLDVSHPVIESIYMQYYQEPRYRPSPITRQLYEAGLFGRKSGRGFYRYVDGEQQVPAEAAPPQARPPRVWLDPMADAGLRAPVAALLASLGTPIDDGEQPQADALCVLLPLGDDVTGSALARGLDPTRCVGLDALFPLQRRRVLLTTPLTTAHWREAAHGLFAADGVAVSVVADSAGGVAQRVVALIVNIACDMAQQGIASPTDIDRAIRLGLGYPQGPLAWGDALGAARVLTILQRMHAFYGDPRYRPSPWLLRRAGLGVSLLTVPA